MKEEIVFILLWIAPLSMCIFGYYMLYGLLFYDLIPAIFLSIIITPFFVISLSAVILNIKDLNLGGKD